MPARWQTLRCARAVNSASLMSSKMLFQSWQTEVSARDNATTTPTHLQIVRLERLHHQAQQNTGTHAGQALRAQTRHRTRGRDGALTRLRSCTRNQLAISTAKHAALLPLPLTAPATPTPALESGSSCCTCNTRAIQYVKSVQKVEPVLASLGIVYHCNEFSCGQ